MSQFLTQIADIRAVVSDLDGVAYRGELPITDSVAAFRTWHRRGIPYAFVTNNATKSAEQFAAKLDRMGIPATPAQVFNTVSGTAAVMRGRWPAGTRVFAIGEEPLLDALRQAGYHLGADDAEVVVLGFDAELTYAKLRTAVRAALGGAAIIVTNPDVLAPTEDGYEPCVGVLAAAVSAAVPGAASIVVGKPEPLLIEQALAYLGTAPADTVMIGDQIGTDIVAGQRAGLRSILIASDIPRDPGAVAVPDGIVASLLELIDGPAAPA
ncbi:HAD-IIA family hydrolase [Chelatococcus reniformis]|uniref:Acid sugar phosphatase n=1 Tax=Chelatococcus reniformis TaxID=1494448 RepID=A0A916XLY3_9HYPH|nr:HAD-IIA family hydrolase [Chelatococcus reniformis]GGC85058.1 acid sugar phosphatase [Chelatococcus reniformis]